MNVGETIAKEQAARAQQELVAQLARIEQKLDELLALQPKKAK